MTLRRALLLVLASLVLAVRVVADAWAGPPADQVRLQIDRVVTVLADPSLRAAGRERVRPWSGRSPRRSSTSAR